MKVCVTGSLDCAHQLPGTEVHGHTYMVTVCIRADIRPDGKVFAFELLQNHLNAILNRLDHKSLNTVLAIPTAENLALRIKGNFEGLDVFEGLDITVRVQIGNGGYVETE